MKMQLMFLVLVAKYQNVPEIGWVIN